MTRDVTIVIPVHGRSALTRGCLDSLVAAGLPAGTQVIVVDDVSPDDTAAVLAEYPWVHVLRRSVQGGFAAACNDGVAYASTPWVCLLNNDTIVQPGWLQAMLSDALANPGTAAVGARLCYPNGTIQHAGVVIGRDRQPHHAYVGFPADHPAVLSSRDLQVVTAACLLLDRRTFLTLGGFDTGFRNGHEDVDLCLRLRAFGYRVRYCAEAVIVHLESATRGRRTGEAAENGRRYLRRWAGSVRPDDVETYAADGLLEFGYEGDETPLRLTVEPILSNGGVSSNGDCGEDGKARVAALEELLRLRSRQVAELLSDNVALTLAVASGRVPRPRREAECAEPDADDGVQVALIGLQRALAARLPGFSPQAGAEYRESVRRMHERLAETLPPGARVAVAGRGDSSMLAVPFAAAVEHFPGDAAGRWLGYHPADSDAATELLVAARERGMTHLVLPAGEHWWLDFYPGFAAELGSPLEHSGSGGPLVFELVRATAQVRS